MYIEQIPNGLSRSNELKRLRRLNAKVFQKTEKSLVMNAHVGHIHYYNKLGVGDGEKRLREIDQTLVNRGTHWEFLYHSFQPYIPKFADETAIFRDVYGKKDHEVRYRFVDVKHVEGRLEEKGYSGAPQVVYDNAFEDGIHLIYGFTRSAFAKLIRIDKEPTKDLEFKFELQTPRSSLFNNSGGQLNLKTGDIRNVDKAMLAGVEGQLTHFRPFKVWDSSPFKKKKVIDVRVTIEGGKLFLTKIIPRSYFKGAVYPVYTDTTTSYYTGGGDGRIYSADVTVWATARDATTGTVDASDSGPDNIGSADAGGTPNYICLRSNFPADTSGIGSGNEVTAAILYTYTNAITDQGADSMYVVPTSYADPASPVSGDYDNLTFTDYGNRDTTVTTSQYNGITLNATGEAAVNITGTTEMGIIGSDDFNDTAPGGNQRNYWKVYWSEQTGTSNDPYYEITYSASGGGAAAPAVFFGANF